MEPISLGAAAIMGGSALLGQGATAYAQGRMNKKTRQWNEKMYAMQRGHALEDWNMQNKYNAPAQQMQRLKEAGLNPNMVYGKGTIDNQTGQVRSTDVKGWQPNAPKIDLTGVGSILSQYADIKLKDAQTNNLQKVAEVTVEEKMLKRAQALKIAKDTDEKTFDLMFKQSMYEYNLDMAQERLRNVRADTSQKLGSNERAWQVHTAMLAPNLNEKLANIAYINAKTANTKFERQILEANAQKIKQESHIFGTTGRQQIELNNLIQQEKYQNMILTGEKILTEQFRRELEDKKFTQEQINSILQILVPNKPSTSTKNVNINRNY